MNSSRLMSLRRSDERGDTILEVLIAIAVVSSILASVFVLANRTSLNSRQAQEHQEALKYASSQIELLNEYLKHTEGTHPTGNSFCMQQTALQPLDYVGNAPSACQVNNGAYQYSLKISYDSANNVYTATVTWPSATSGTDSISLTYRANTSGGSYSELVVTSPVLPGPCSSDKDIVFVLDHSLSMTWDWNPGISRYSILTGLMDDLINDSGMAIGNRGSIVAFSQAAWVEQGLTNNAPALINASDNPTVDSFQTYTHYIAALQTARNELVANGTPARPKVIVLISDGYPDDAGFGTAVAPTLDIPANEAIIYPWVTTNLASASIRVHTVGINPGIGFNPILSNIASLTGGAYRSVLVPADLATSFDLIGDLVTCP